MLSAQTNMSLCKHLHYCHTWHRGNISFYNFHNGDGVQILCIFENKAEMACKKWIKGLSECRQGDQGCPWRFPDEEGEPSSARQNKKLFFLQLHVRKQFTWYDVHSQNGNTIQSVLVNGKLMYLAIIPQWVSSHHVTHNEQYMTN